MERTFVLNGLHCPHCSAEIEKDVRGLDGVTMSSVNLVNQTLKVNTAPNYSGDIFAEVCKIVHSHEPDVAVSEKGKGAANASAKGTADLDDSKRDIFRLAIGAAVYILGLLTPVVFKENEYVSLGLLIIAYLALGGNVVLQAVCNILKGRVFDENFLMTVSTVGAFMIGSYSEAVAVMLFYQIGEFFQELAVKRSRKSISDLMDIRPEYANVMRDGKLVTAAPEDVSAGDIIVVRPGEKIPLDGVVVEGKSMLDTVALTGESVPRSVKSGDTALSGCINQSGVLTIKVTKEFASSTVCKIMDMIENAASRKAPAENFITKFAQYYTPIVVIVALFLAVIPPLFFGAGWSDWIRRGLVFLVISCPCALVISIPLTFFGGIGAASRRGVLVKGGNYLEALDNVDTIVFDKTGTLTQGVFKVSSVIAADGFSENQVIEYAAKAESFSTHPIARSIQSEYNAEVDNTALADYTELAGCGVSVVDGGVKIVAGNDKAMEEAGVKFEPCGRAGTRVYVAADGKFAGCIVISDMLKADSGKAVSGLNKMGITKTVMLTGDNEQIAASVADELGISQYFAELLPDQKVEILERLSENKKNNKKTAFVGDGINDAPVLARADVGIAMGALGSDAAIEAADIVLMTDEPSKLIDAVKIARATKRIVTQNIVFALGIKCVFLLLGALGAAGMWVAVFGDVGVMIIAVLNAMRILKK